MNRTLYMADTTYVKSQRFPLNLASATVGFPQRHQNSRKLYKLMYFTVASIQFYYANRTYTDSEPKYFIIEDNGKAKHHL